MRGDILDLFAVNPNCARVGFQPVDELLSATDSHVSLLLFVSTFAKRVGRLVESVASGRCGRHDAHARKPFRNRFVEQHV